MAVTLREAFFPRSRGGHVGWLRGGNEGSWKAEWAAARGAAVAAVPGVVVAGDRGGLVGA